MVLMPSGIEWFCSNTSVTFYSFKATLLKREVVLISFIILLMITGTWGHVRSYIDTGLKTYLIYSMTVFCVMSILLTKTKIIDLTIDVILLLLDRVTGGAGYVSVVVSSFKVYCPALVPEILGDGIYYNHSNEEVRIPAEFVANIESSTYSLGNMIIPPSGNITTALGALTGMSAYGGGGI